MALAAKAATSTVPIVFAIGGDPIKLGHVASLRRPGINVTGWTQLSVEVGPKRLELARELFPGATTIALLVNPANPLATTVSKDLQAVADTRAVRLHVLHASTEADFEPDISSGRRLHLARILKGENPADLRVVQSTKVELILNLRTARALRLIVPLPLLGRADEVIE